MEFLELIGWWEVRFPSFYVLWPKLAHIRQRWGLGDRRGIFPRFRWRRRPLLNKRGAAFAVVIPLVFLAFIGIKVGMIWNEMHPHPPAPPPADCEQYNVGRVECGAKSGGNPKEAGK